MHLCASTRTRSCRVSRAIAPVGQTCAHGAGLQCRQRLGIDMLYCQPGDTWILDFGTGSSTNARAGSLLRECATAQANSHCRQPMNTVCMLVMANLSGFRMGRKSSDESFVPHSRLIGAINLGNSGLYLSAGHCDDGVAGTAWRRQSCRNTPVSVRMTMADNAAPMIT